MVKWGDHLRSVGTKMCEHDEQDKFRANGLEYCTKCNKYINIGLGKSNEDLAKPTNKITCPGCGLLDFYLGKNHPKSDRPDWQDSKDNIIQCNSCARHYHGCPYGNQPSRTLNNGRSVYRGEPCDEYMK